MKFNPVYYSELNRISELKHERWIAIPNQPDSFRLQLKGTSYRYMVRIDDVEKKWWILMREGGFSNLTIFDYETHKKEMYMISGASYSDVFDGKQTLDESFLALGYLTNNVKQIWYCNKA